MQAELKRLRGLHPKLVDVAVYPEFTKRRLFTAINRANRRTANLIQLELSRMSESPFRQRFVPDGRSQIPSLEDPAQYVNECLPQLLKVNRRCTGQPTVNENSGRPTWQAIQLHQVPVDSHVHILIAQEEKGTLPQPQGTSATSVRN